MQYSNLLLEKTFQPRDFISRSVHVTQMPNFSWAYPHCIWSHYLRTVNSFSSLQSQSSICIESFVFLNRVLLNRVSLLRPQPFPVNCRSWKQSTPPWVCQSCASKWLLFHHSPFQRITFEISELKWKEEHVSVPLFLTHHFPKASLRYIVFLEWH